MKYSISGTTLQVVEVELEPEEAIYTQSGGMTWMSQDIRMETGMKGGVLGGIKRRLSGESAFLTTYRAQKAGRITIGVNFVGKIIDLDLAQGESVICQKTAFMCAQESVELGVHFQKKLGAGLFGGEGFILQKITGPGLAFLEIDGEVVQKDLGEGERLRVDPGYVGAFEPSVKYDMERVSGVKNMLFSGEGLFLATLTGPGKVWLQTLPKSRVAGSLRSFFVTGK